MCPARLLILGIDAASPALLRRWMADGSLPHLASLAARGIRGPVRSVAGFHVGSTWPSFQTGLSPAGHGLHYLDQVRVGSYDYHQPFTAPGGVLGEPFWTVLSRAGPRLAVLDVPLSRLDPDLRGIQTVEWGGHDAIFGFQAHPPELGGEILSRFGPHPQGPVCDGRREDAAAWQAFTAGLVRGAGLKAQLTRACLGREDWDCLIQVFTEAHCAGHQAWHLHDPTHPAHDPELTRLVGDPLHAVYRAVDAAVGQVLAEAGEATVLVTSLHGMACFTGAPFLLPDLLNRLRVAAPAAVPQAPRTARTRAVDGLRAAWNRLPPRVRDRLRPLRQRWFPDPLPPPRSLGIDPARSRCFAVGNGAPVGGIRLNLAGREPEGRLEPGPEADAFVAQLRRDLLEIVDERTGRPAIRAVHRTADLHQGPALDRLPDLLVEWSDERCTGSMALAGGREATLRMTSPRIGTVEGRNWYGRSGDHRPGGLYLLAGPGIPAGGEAPAADVTAFAPAIIATLTRGASLPETLHHLSRPD